MNEFWEQFKATGAVTDYLSFVNSSRQGAEEASDAANNNGDSSARSENR